MFCTRYSIFSKKMLCLSQIVMYLRVEPDKQRKASHTVPVQGSLRLQQHTPEHGEIGVPVMFSI